MLMFLTGDDFFFWHQNWPQLYKIDLLEGGQQHNLFYIRERTFYSVGDWQI